MNDDRAPATAALDGGPEGGADAEGRSSLTVKERQPGFLARLFGLAADPAPDDPAPADQDATAAERALLSNIKTMRDQRVDDIMIPRADIVAVAEDASLADLTAAFRAGAHSRMPVYRETLDDPVGFVHVKDLALARGFGGAPDSAAPGAVPMTGATAGDAGGPAGLSASDTISPGDRETSPPTDPAAPFDIKDFIRRILVAPPSMLTRRLLQRMQQSRIHMALVVDEYGGVDGLITIEDLVEQIVGDIEDEHDEAETTAWRREAPGVFVANARAALSAFEAEASVDLLPDDLDEDVETLGGLVFMLANRVPERGEVVFHPQGHEFEVIEADPRRIKRLRVSLHDPARAAAAAE